MKMTKRSHFQQENGLMAITNRINGYSITENPLPKTQHPNQKQRNTGPSSSNWYDIDQQ